MPEQMEREMANDKNGDGGNNQPANSNGRRRTRDDLKRAIEAVREAAATAGLASATAKEMSEKALRGLQGSTGEPEPPEKEWLAATGTKQASRPQMPPARQEKQQQGGGHVDMPQQQEGKSQEGQFFSFGDARRRTTSAYEQFMQALDNALDRAGRNVEVEENRSWMKIESRLNGHRIYISKGKTSVNRVESTLPPHLIEGAMEPERTNGRIASWIPPNPEVVEKAIDLLADERTDQIQDNRGRQVRGGRFR